MKQRALLLGGIGLSVLFLWLALRGTDGDRMRQAFAAANLWLVPVFLAVLFAYYWTKAWRWQALLAPMRAVEVRLLYRPIMIGYAGSMVLPMQLGELVRVFVASRQLRLPGMPLLSSVALERLLDFLSLLALIGLALMLDTGVPPVLTTAGWIIGAGVLLAAAFAIVYVLWTPAVLRALGRGLGFLPGRWRDRLLEQVRVGALGLEALRAPALLARVVALSLVQWAFMLGCIYLSLIALDIDAPISAAFITLMFTVIGVTLPTSPGYIGSIQLAYALALRPFGVSAEAAFAASVFFHALANLSVIVVGIYYLHRMGYTWSDLRRETAAAANAEHS